jgi:hypothetical protein
LRLGVALPLGLYDSYFGEAPLMKTWSLALPLRFYRFHSARRAAPRRGAASGRSWSNSKNGCRRR